MTTFVHCRGCGEKIHESAPTCPKCGAPQVMAASAVAPPVVNSEAVRVASTESATPAQTRAGKPRSVSRAAKMLWAVLALGVVQVGARAPALMRTSDLVMVVAELAVTCLVLGLVIFKISEGRNWARYALIALFFTGAMPSMGIHGPASSSAISTIAFVVALVLQVCAMVLLFLHQARQWFKAQAVAKPA